MELTQKQKTMAKIACVALAILIMSPNTVSVAYGKMKEAFPGVTDAQMANLSGWVSLIGIPFTIFAIPIARKVSCKTLLLLIQIIYIVTGCSVFFIRNFNVILVMRLIMGIGKGLYIPILIATISYIFQGNERTQVLGFRQAGTMVGGIVFSLIGGVLAGIGWQYVWLIYAVGIPCLIIAWICLPNVKLPTTAEGGEKVPLNQTLNFTVIMSVIKAYLLILAVHCSAVTLAIHVNENQIGNPAMVGTAVALMMGAGALAGIFLGKMFAKMGRYTVTLGIALLAIGLFLCAFATNMGVIIIGQICLGFANATYDSSMQTLFTRAVNPASLVVATGLYSFAQNFGQFSFPYIVTKNVPSTKNRFLVMGVLAVIMLVVDLFTSQKYKWYGTNYPADKPLPEGAEVKAE